MGIVLLLTGKSPAGEDQRCDGKFFWSPEVVAQAQREDPDIGPVVLQLLQEWKKPTTGELQPTSQATRAVWAQFDLSQLQEGVLYVQSTESNPATKGRMVLPQTLVKEALLEVHDGPAGAHLGRMKTLKKARHDKGSASVLQWLSNMCQVQVQTKNQEHLCGQYPLGTPCKGSIST